MFTQQNVRNTGRPSGAALFRISSGCRCQPANIETGTGVFLGILCSQRRLSSVSVNLLFYQNSVIHYTDLERRYIRNESK